MGVKRVRKIGLWLIIGAALSVLLGVNVMGKTYLAETVSMVALIVLVAWIVSMAVWSQLRR